MSHTCPLCTLNVIQHVRDLLADEETIFVTSEIIDWLDEQIDVQMNLLASTANGLASQATNGIEPWSLRFYRDGTEDIAVIHEADGEELAYSRPFWLPEGGDPVPPTLAAMRLMAAAPKLLTALIAASDWIDAQVGRPRTEVQATIQKAIAEATGSISLR